MQLNKPVWLTQWGLRDGFQGWAAPQEGQFPGRDGFPRETSVDEGGRGANSSGLVNSLTVSKAFCSYYLSFQPPQPSLAIPQVRIQGWTHFNSSPIKGIGTPRRTIKYCN